MGIQIELNKGRVPVKVWTRDIEPEAIQQLLNVASLPIVQGHVAAMPDVHAGIGATVGSVIPTRQAIIPAAVGDHSGGGGRGYRLRHERGAHDAVRRGFAGQSAPAAHGHRARRAVRFRAARGQPDAWQRLAAGRAGARAAAGRHRRQASGADEDAAPFQRNLAVPAWHAGRRQSLHRTVPGRGRGGVGDAAFGVARHRQRHWPLFHRRRAEGHAAPPHAPAGSRSRLFQRGFGAVRRLRGGGDVGAGLRPAQPAADAGGGARRVEAGFAAVQARRRGDQLPPQLRGARAAFRRKPVHHPQGRDFGTGGRTGHHPRQHGRALVHRARAGQRAILPLVRARGGTAHEPQRRYSRFDLETQTAGIECRKDGGVVDEIPAAYKDIDQVMDNQRDLVEIVHTLKQVLCVKG